MPVTKDGAWRDPGSSSGARPRGAWPAGHASFSRRSVEENGQNLMHRKFHPNIRKEFSTAWVPEHQNRLLREDVECPSLEVVQNYLDAILCNLLWDDPA